MRLAVAMAQGHLWVVAPPWSEYVTVAGRQYFVHPPGSALICLPFALLGFTSQQAVSWMLGIGGIWLAWELTRSIWLTAFLALGTTFSHEALLGASWNFALVASVPFSLLAIAAAERSEAAECGIWAAFAALCRYDLVLAFPIYAWALRARREKAVVFALVAGLLWTTTYVWFNEARFGTPWDRALGLWYAQDAYRFQVGDHGVFSLHYVPLALYCLLFAAPVYSRLWPWFRPTPFGQAIISLSPGLLLAVQPNSWFLCAAICSIPSLTVWAHGFSQLGCRYYTQVLPYLLASMRGQERSWNAKVLILLSIVLSCYFSLVNFS